MIPSLEFEGQGKFLLPVGGAVATRASKSQGAVRKRRSELEIAAAILMAILDEQRVEDGHVRKTRLQARVYLSWNCLNTHIERLRRNGLLSTEELQVTDRGRSFLRTYFTDVRSVLGEYGFLNLHP